MALYKFRIIIIIIPLVARGPSLVKSCHAKWQHWIAAIIIIIIIIIMLILQLVKLYSVLLLVVHRFC